MYENLTALYWHRIFFPKISDIPQKAVLRNRNPAVNR